MHKLIAAQKNKGFTLIELMIVIAIVAILVAIALPQFQIYTRKAGFTEVLNATSAPKANIEAYYQEQSSLPDATLAAKYGNDGSKNVDSVVVSLSGDNVTIVATGCTAGSGCSLVDGETDQKTVTLTGEPNGDTLNWTCTSNAEQKYLPSTCLSSI